MNLRRNTIYGALGFGLPTLLGLVAYPIILHGLGASAMGVFILASTIGGSFAFAEFGLTTVTTKFVAEAIGRGDVDGASEAVGTSLAFYSAIGMLAAGIVWLAAPLIVVWAGVGIDLQRDAVVVFRAAAVQLVVSYWASVLSATLKGLHRFDLASAAGSLLSVFMWGGTAIAVAVMRSGVIGAALASASANVLALCASAAMATPLMRREGMRLGAARPRIRTLKGMLRHGVFMSVNGVAGVLMGQVQNLIISGALRPAALTISATAVQIVSKINTLTAAAFEMVLPVSAVLAQGRDPVSLRHLRGIYLKALSISFAISVGASVTLYAVAPALIRFWLRSSIDAEVIPILRIYCIGLAINGATPVTYHFLNGIGRSEINTGFMLSGTTLFYLVLWLMVRSGLTLEKFAAASAVSLIANGVVYFAFAEIVVWRRWLAPQRG